MKRPSLDQPLLSHTALISAIPTCKSAQAAPQEEKDDAGVVFTSPSEAFSGWKTTLIWAGAIMLWYIALQMVILPNTMQADPDARARLMTQIPVRFYQYSESAFFTASVLNLLSFVFEETQEKRQLALLSALIKGLSWHCDHLIVNQLAVVKFDGYGALLLPSRYVQWSCTTPTMLFTLSKISDLSSCQVAVVMFCDWVMILTGYIAAEYPLGFASMTALAISCIMFYVVLYFGLCSMIRSALTEANTTHAKMSLHFTLWSSLVIWHMFPIAWCVTRMGPWIAPMGEALSMFSNFGAKVVFSSCILYNNFVTLRQRRLAAQLEQEHKDRIRMVDELKHALKSKDEFISVIGHELRTPLNAVIQLSSAVMANFGAPGTWQRHYMWMETITRSAQHLMGIINDIITVRAARSGMNLKQELVHVGHVVNHVVRTLNPMTKRGVVVEKAVAKQLPPIIADERRLIQLLSNLLGNALKFTEKGKVCVSVRVDSGGRGVLIKVQDTGCGIPKAELKNLLQPFKQVDMSKGRKYGGTGLGLSIANQLVQAHNGLLTIDSLEGQGTTVMVKLPVLQPETRPFLEIPFRTAYLAAGYSFEELMSPEVASFENRKVPSFRSKDMQGSLRSSLGSRPSPRTSIDSHRTSMHVEQFSWDDYYDNDLPEDNISAAASGMGGPPPMAVALVSSLYASSAPPLSTVPALSKLTNATHDPSRAGITGLVTPEGQGAVTGGAFVSQSTEQSSQQLGPLAGQNDKDDVLEPNDYAGTWHRAAKFGDNYDHDKMYYAYDNRMSYEYRPSMDNTSGYTHDWVNLIHQDQRVKGTLTPAPSIFRRISMSLNSSLRNSLENRTSADAMAARRRLSAASSSAVHSSGDARSSAAEAKEKLLRPKGSLPLGTGKPTL